MDNGPDNFGFDNAGERVPVVQPIYPDDEQPILEQVQARDTIGQAIKEFVRGITTNATALQTGQWLHLLAFEMGVSPWKTQRELAEALNVSPGRISQIRSEIPRQFQIKRPRR